MSESQAKQAARERREALEREHSQSAGHTRRLLQPAIDALTGR